MSIRLVLAGAGGLGRGVYAWVRSSPQYLQRNNICEIVFIDDAARQAKGPLPVIGDIANYTPRENDRIICTIGLPNPRRAVVDRLLNAGGEFASFVDDRAVLGDRVVIGLGAIVCPGAVIDSDVIINRHAHVNINCSIGHDVNIGAYSTLSPTVTIMGEVVCGESVFFGGGSVILPRLTLGKEVTIGAGSVVTKDAPEGVTVRGVPAR